MGMEVYHNLMQKRGIKILGEVRFGLHYNEFFIPILILKNNPNTLVNRRWNWFLILILYSSILKMTSVKFSLVLKGYKLYF